MFFTAVAAMLLPFLAVAQFTLSGTVINGSDQQPLAGASIRLNTGIITQTDTKGKFIFQNLATGKYELTVTFVGFASQGLSVNLNSNQQLAIQLKQAGFLADEVVVRATRASKNSGSTYQQLGKAELEKNNFGQDLPYLLNQTPSVVITSDAGAGIGYTGLRIRGSDPTRINVTINGIPYNDTESQGTYWVDLPDFASSVDNIQIQRGVGTSTNGAGAFGASLNIQTTTRRDTAYAELNNTIGSYRTIKNTVSLG